MNQIQKKPKIKCSSAITNIAVPISSAKPAGSNTITEKKKNAGAPQHQTAAVVFPWHLDAHMEIDSEKNPTRQVDNPAAGVGIEKTRNETTADASTKAKMSAILNCIESLYGFREFTSKIAHSHGFVASLCPTAERKKPLQYLLKRLWVLR